MNRKQVLIRGGIALAIIAAFLIGLSVPGNNASRSPASSTSGKATVTDWTCSMHPSVHLPKAGPCPICGMDLIPSGASTEAEPGTATLTLSPAARQRAGIRTAPVTRKAVATTVRMVGILEADETRVREISARVPGRIDKLYLDYTGVSVTRGDKLFDLYSPELFSAQEELLQAVVAAKRLSTSGIESTRLSATRTVDAARERLRLWGMTPTQIKQLETAGTPREHVTIVAPASGVVLHKAKVEGAYVEEGTHVYSIADLSHLWLKLDAYESDLARVSTGQEVEFTTQAYPGRVFTGTVAFIDPFLTTRSRSIKVRVDVPNLEGILKPGMFASALVRAPVQDKAGNHPLVIPASAPLLTGKRAVVYLVDPQEPGRFTGLEVSLGPRAGDVYVVLDGLHEGDVVVSHGSFKIDSALQIQARPSMMSPEDGGALSHVHGGHAPHGGGSEPVAMEDPFPDLSPAFLARMDAMLLAYYDITDALTRDDGPTARELVTKFPLATGSELTGAAADAWATLLKRFNQATGAMVTAETLEDTRAEYHNLSRTMIEAVRQFRATGSVPALQFHCPMAIGPEGADWLQPSEGTRNPYYGSRMFRCGGRSATLISPETGESSPGDGQ